MKTHTLLRLPVLACAGALLAAANTFADISKAPIYEENFNLEHSRLEYRFGAKLGVPGSGVSGKIGDRAYVATPRSTENAPDGPVANALAPIAPDSMSAFTYTFWYLLDEYGPDLQVPFSTAGTLMLINEKGFELRIENQLAQPRQYVFTPGANGPLAGWLERGRWIFAAFSWDQATNTVVIHQGTPDAAVAFMRDMSRPTPANPTLPRTDLARHPETIGNTSRLNDRPLAGRLDNLRVFDRVLDRSELESIRRADLANTELSFR